MADFDRRETIIIRTGEPGSGKTWSAVHFLVYQWIPYHQGLIYTNLPINVEALAEYCTRPTWWKPKRDEAKRDEIASRFIIIPNELERAWNEGEKDPVDYFKQIQEEAKARDPEGKTPLSGAMIILDEAGKKWPSSHRNTSRKDATFNLVRFLSTLRHEGAKLVLITQRMKQIDNSIRELASLQFDVRNRNSEPEPVTGATLEDWQQIRAKLFGTYYQLTRECVFRNINTVFVEEEDQARNGRVDPSLFPLYRSHSRDDGQDGEPEKMAWERMSWPRFICWLLKRNWLPWGWRFVLACFLYAVFCPPFSLGPMAANWFMDTVPNWISSALSTERNLLPQLRQPDREYLQQC